MSSGLLFHKIIGTGKPIIFLHGFLEDHSMWNEIYPSFLDSNYQIILVDLPCHGASKFDGEICSMSYMASELNKLLEAKNITNPHIFGHSMGGYVGLELIQLRAASLTLVHSNFWADDTIKKENRNRVIELVEKDSFHFVREAIPGLFYAKNVDRCANDIQDLINQARKIPPKYIQAATRGMRDRRDNHEQMNQRDVSIIHGYFDPTIPNEKLDLEISKLSKKPICKTLKETGHMSIWESRIELIEQMKALIVE